MRCWRVDPDRLAVASERAAETTTRCWHVGPGRLAAATERAAASEHAEGAAAVWSGALLFENWVWVAGVNGVL